MEVRCGRADVEVWRPGDLQLGRHAAGLGTRRCRDVEVWRRAPRVWRRAGVEEWRTGGVRCGPGDVEVRCRRVDVDVWSPRALKV